MKLIRFKDSDGLIFTGTHHNGTARCLIGNPLEKIEVSDTRVQVDKPLVPIVPSAIIGIGANYKGVFEAQGKPLPDYPVVFFKCHNALQNPDDPIVLPRRSIKAESVKFEGELAVIIGKSGKNIPAEQAMEHVFGYTIANDVSASDWQGERVGNQWCKGKSFDTFCPLGPVMVTKDEIPDPEKLEIITKVNGHIEQRDKVGNMCFSIPEIIAFVSAGFTLPRGAVILTGTPSGARFLKPGEYVEITIDGIGTLRNPVVEEEAYPSDRATEYARQ